MKFPFNKKRDKKVTFSEALKVTSTVRIIQEAPSTKSHTKPKQSSLLRSREYIKDVKPPSPTGVKEQALHDQIIADEKEAEELNSHYSQFACGSTACSSQGDDSSDPNDSEVTKGWKNLTKIINMKMEDFQDSLFDCEFLQNLIPDDLGEYAMTAVEKNRNEMDQMLVNIDKEAKGIESKVASPISWLQNKQSSCISGASTTIEETSLQPKTLFVGDSCTGGEHALVCGHNSIYHRTMTTCTDMNGCSTTPDIIPGQEKDVIIMVKLPSD